MRRKHLPVFSFLPLIFLALLGVGVTLLWRSSQFTRFTRFNLVLATDPVTLVSLDRKQMVATVVTFPNDLFVPEVVPRLGGYKIGQVYKVGELDHRGGQVLSWTVGELLGIPIDGYLFQSSKLSGLKSFFLAPRTFFGSRTNLNLWDLGQFAFVLLQVRSDKIKTIDLGNKASPLVLADGSVALGVDKEDLDAALTGSFLEEGVVDEKFRIEIVNSTPVPGLGAKVARTLTNIGATVVNVGSTENQVPSCEVRVEKKNVSSLTAQRVATIWQCKIVAGSPDRADVGVVLGTDLAKRY